MNPSTRYSSVDALRGLIMMIMAIDHASATIARQHSNEFWAGGAMSSYTSAFPFLTRWITHLCAPGFFFLMGAGIYWSGDVRRTLQRGFAIFVLAQVFESSVMYLMGLLPPPAVRLSTVTGPPPIDGSSLYWGLIVLSALGLVMMVCSALLRLPPWSWLLISALCVIATHSLLPADGKPGPWWFTLLLAPGLSQHLLVTYPVIPWLAVAAAGLYFGHWWRRNPDLGAGRVAALGATVLLFSIALRAAGGWGNIRLPRDSSWIEFLNNVKYPPSLVFWTMAIGLNLLLLALLMRLPARFLAPRSPFVVFGQSPLFFYMAHFALFLALGFAFFRTAASLEFTYLVWAFALVVLYPVCLRYRDFKLGQPRESLWRLL